MKKVFFSTVSALLFLCLNSAYGETTASQTVTATLSSFVTVSNVDSSSTSVQVIDGGRLSSDLTPSFKFSSNSKNGASATFNVKVNTSDSGQIDAISGSNSNGKIVLSNTSFKPSSSAVINALSDNPTGAANPDAITYQMSFTASDKNKGNAPVFDKAGNTASGNVLIKNGSNTITIVIEKDSAQKGTFSSNDKSGSYQATIFCTSADL